MLNPRILFGSDPATGKDLYIPFESLRGQNFHVMGNPGSGKSRFELRLCILLIALHLPLIVLDLKGDLARNLTRYCVRQRLTQRTKVFDPEDVKSLGIAPGLNPLDDKLEPDARAAAAKWVLKSLFQESKEQNPWIDHTTLLAFNLLAQASNPDAPFTIFEGEEVLKSNGSEFLTKLLSDLNGTGDYLRSQFAEYNKFPVGERAKMFNPLRNRLSQLRMSSYLASVFAQPKTTINFDEIIAGRGIFIGNVHHPDISQPELDFTGRALFAKIKSAIFRRPERDWSIPCYVVIDEVQRLAAAGDSEQLADIFERGRSFGAQFVAAHQNLSQLVPANNVHDTRFVDALTGLSSLRVYFQCSRKDAEHGGIAMSVFGDQMEKTCRERKHTVETVCFRPVSTYKPTYSKTISESESEEESYGETSSVSASKEVSSGQDISLMRAEAESETQNSSVSSAEVDMDSDSSGEYSGSGLAMGQGSAVVSNSDTLEDIRVSESSSQVDVSTSGSMKGSAITRGGVQGESHGKAVTKGQSKAQTLSLKQGHSEGVAEATGESSSHSHGRSHSEAETCGLVPATEFEEFIQEGSPTFVGTDEARERFYTKLTHQERRHFILKFGILPAIALVAPAVEVPIVLESEIEQFKAKIYKEYGRPIKQVLDDLNSRVARYLEAPAMPGNPVAEDPQEEESFGCDCGGPRGHVENGIHCRRPGQASAQSAEAWVKNPVTGKLERLKDLLSENETE